jgi:hypothetical protein
MFIKKFYDTATVETGGGTEAAVLEQPKTEIKTPSFAESMAKGGVRSTDNQPAKAFVNTEKKEEPKTVEKSEQVETTTTTSKTEKANSESQPTEKKEEAEPKPIAQSASTEKSWQEVLKNRQPNEVLKELGFDEKSVQFFQKLNKFDKKEFFFNLLNEWESKGNLKGYLNELETDYGKMSPEEVMRHQLSEEYGTKDQRKLDVLFKNKIIQAYKLDSDDPSEVEEGKILLEAEADKYRPNLLTRQQTKLFPQVPEPPPPPPPDNSAQEAEQNFEAYKSTISKDPYSEKVFEKKQITIGKGEDKMVIPVDPETIKNILFDTDKWTETQFEKTSNADGTFKYTPKVENQILTAQFASNPQKFIQDLAQHYLSIGGKKAIEPLNNAKPPDNVTVSNSVAEPNSLAEGMGKSGRRVSGVM